MIDKEVTDKYLYGGLQKGSKWRYVSTSNDVSVNEIACFKFRRPESGKRKIG